MQVFLSNTVGYPLLGCRTRLFSWHFPLGIIPVPVDQRASRARTGQRAERLLDSMHMDARALSRSTGQIRYTLLSNHITHEDSPTPKFPFANLGREPCWTERMFPLLLSFLNYLDLSALLDNYILFSLFVECLASLGDLYKVGAEGIADDHAEDGIRWARSPESLAVADNSGVSTSCATSGNVFPNCSDSREPAFQCFPMKPCLQSSKSF